MNRFGKLFLVLLSLLFITSCAKKEEEAPPASGSPLPVISVKCGDVSCM